MTKIMEDLQGVLHDLHELSFKQGQFFTGIVIEDLPVQYRDISRSQWRITFEVQPPSRNRPPEEVTEEEVAQSPTV
jgi:hypothetical protein